MQIQAFKEVDDRYFNQIYMLEDTTLISCSVLTCKLRCYPKGKGELNLI